MGMSETITYRITCDQEGCNAGSQHPWSVSPGHADDYATKSSFKKIKDKWYCSNHIPQFKKPSTGEMIYGCHHTPACGVIVSVLEHITADGMDHYMVLETSYDRKIRVRRELNLQIYEVTIQTDYSGM